MIGRHAAVELHLARAATEPSPAPALAAPARPRARRPVPLAGPAVRSKAPQLLAGLLACLPAIVATARALRDGWHPVADRAIIATRAYDVFSWHMPLIGQYSYAGHVTNKLTYSLGPMLYWLLAPAAHLGAPATLALSTAAVNVACVLGTVALARRRGGLWLMLVTAVAIALMCRSLAAMDFYDIWNPAAALFPLLLLVFACWSLACGEHRLLPLVALVASFTAQCEDAFIPPTLGLVAVGLLGLVLRRQARRPRWLLGALAVLALCWWAPVLDQVAHGGNLELVARAAGERKESLGAKVGARAVVHAVGVQPWWLTRPPDPWVRKVDVRRPVGPFMVLTAALILGWLALAAALAWRRRRPDVLAGAAIALVLCAALFSLASATPTTPLLAATLGYTLWWASICGMVVWLVAGWAAVILFKEGLVRALAGHARRLAGFGRPLAAPARGLAVGLVAVAVAGGASAASGTPDEHDFEFGPLKAINASLKAIPRGSTVLLNAQLDGIITPLRPEVTFALRRRGVRALGSGAYLRLGSWYEKWSHPYDYVVWIYDKGNPLPKGRTIGRTVLVSGGRRHTLMVAMAPAKSG